MLKLNGAIRNVPPLIMKYHQHEQCIIIRKQIQKTLIFRKLFGNTMKYVKIFYKLP